MKIKKNTINFLMAMKIKKNGKLLEKINENYRL